MGLRLKFNLVLLLVFLVGLGVAGWISREILIRNAREEVSRNAGLMMETALAVRGYTITQVRPHLDMQLMRAFLPQSVPAFAAAETMGELRKKYPDYFYKEATLNPTNPRNRASDWEADIVQEFRNRPAVKELGGERDTPTGRALYIARPIQITNPACLGCHTTPEAAPEDGRMSASGAKSTLIPTASISAAAAAVTSSVAVAAAAVSEMPDSSSAPGNSVKPLTSLVTIPYS